MIELFIVGFACISVVAFVSTNDQTKNNTKIVIESEEIK
tara:strand:- start:170 stop:286 length:117 start_codon:yes stop_codon:yes gene_type:complete